MILIWNGDVCEGLKEGDKGMFRGNKVKVWVMLFYFNFKCILK